MTTRTLDGIPSAKKRRYTPYKNGCLPSDADRLVFILMYLRQAGTQDAFGQLFGIIINRVANVYNGYICFYQSCNAALAEVGELPAREQESLVSDGTLSRNFLCNMRNLRWTHPPLRLFFHDGVERPIQRPKDAEAQKAYYSGKKKQHTVKNNILVNSESKVVFLTLSYEGRTHDKRIADISGYAPPPKSILHNR